MSDDYHVTGRIVHAKLSAKPIEMAKSVDPSATKIGAALELAAPAFTPVPDGRGAPLLAPEARAPVGVVATETDVGAKTLAVAELRASAPTDSR